MNFIEFLRVTSICGLLGSFSFSAVSFAQGESSLGGVQVDSDATRITSIEEAEAYAERVAAELGPESVLFITHIGESLPEPLRFLVVKLQRLREKHLRKGDAFKIKVDLIRPSAMEKEIEQGIVDAEKLLTQFKVHVGASETHIENFSVLIDQASATSRTVGQHAKLALKRLFGIAGGVTIWGKYYRDGKKWMRDFKGTLIPTALAAPSIGYSLYLAEAAGANVSVIGGSVALCAWVWVNMLFKDEINEAMFQGKRLTRGKGNSVNIGPSFTFSMLTQNIRGILTNVIVQLAAFGPELAFSEGGLSKNLENSLMNSVARNWVDRWISKQFQEGRWSKRKFDAVFLTWNTGYPVMKNFHLFGLGGVGTWLYYSFAAIGLGNVLWTERHAIKHTLVESLWGGFVKKRTSLESGLAHFGSGCNSIF